MVEPGDQFFVPQNTVMIEELELIMLSNRAIH